MTLISTTAKAGPVRIADVQQVVNSNPNKQVKGNSAQLIVAAQQAAPKPNEPLTLLTAVQNGENGGEQPRGDGNGLRVITEEEFEIAEDTEPCNCPEIPKAAPFIERSGGFPWWLGFGAVPLAFIGFGGGDDDLTPTVESVTLVPSVTPSITPSVSPEPTPEPATLLLFGTGLAGISFAARRWLRRKTEDEETEGSF